MGISLSPSLPLPSLSQAPSVPPLLSSPHSSVLLWAQRNVMHISMKASPSRSSSPQVFFSAPCAFVYFASTLSLSANVQQQLPLNHCLSVSRWGLSFSVTQPKHSSTKCSFGKKGKGKNKLHLLNCVMWCYQLQVSRWSSAGCIYEGVVSILINS